MRDTQNAPRQQIDPRKKRVAQKNIGIAIFLGIFFGPLGYVYVRAFEPAAINALTLNYLLTGIVVVPIHCAILIRTARNDVLHHDRMAVSEFRSKEAQPISE